jgi:hypothetical protein
LLAALLLLSALAFFTGCNLGPQKDAFLRADDEGVLFVRWTREGRQIRGTIEILEKKPDNEIGTTHFMFDGVSDGENVSMAVRSSWTPQGGDKAIKKEITGLLKYGTLTLFMGHMSGPIQFRRATHVEYAEASRKLEMRATKIGA